LVFVTNYTCPFLPVTETLDIYSIPEYTDKEVETKKLLLLAIALVALTAAASASVLRYKANSILLRPSIPKKPW
jgi:hypothetical protein